MAEGSEAHSSPLQASGSCVPVSVMRVKTELVLATYSDLRATTESLGCGPYRLGAVKAQDVESIFVGLDTGLNIP
jgi:hypothetical protein